VNGIVDEFGRALITVNVRATDDDRLNVIEVWIDTAFSGELGVPSRLIESLHLPQAAAVEARLADGNTVLLEAFTCQVEWFGKWRTVELIANSGEYPLLGIGLLTGHRLTIDYPQRTVAID
jgi:Predicted aspartyl protease